VARSGVELGLKLEHLELIHQQLVIVRAHREALHNCAYRAARGGIRDDRVLSRAADTVLAVYAGAGSPHDRCRARRVPRRAA
jgi:hypothetical protein